MSTAIERRRGFETLAWITDDEAEFWTSSSPRGSKNASFEQFPTSKSEDNLLLKSKYDLNDKTNDPLLLMYKNKIVEEAKNVSESAGKRQIFEFDNTMELNENIPGVNMSFLDRLMHQLTRPRNPKADSFSDEEFTEIDENEVTAIVNENIHQPLTMKEERKLGEFLRSFLEELNEETEVIRGTIDQETLINRRSHRARSSLSSDDQLVNRTSI